MGANHRGLGRLSPPPGNFTGGGWQSTQPPLKNQVLALPLFLI